MACSHRPGATLDTRDDENTRFDHESTAARHPGGAHMKLASRLGFIEPFYEKWPRLSEQLSPIYKWTAGGC